MLPSVLLNLFLYLLLSPCQDLASAQSRREGFSVTPTDPCSTRRGRACTKPQPTLSLRPKHARRRQVQTTASVQTVSPTGPSHPCHAQSVHRLCVLETQLSTKELKGGGHRTTTQARDSHSLSLVPEQRNKPQTTQMARGGSGSPLQPFGFKKPAVC